MVLYNIAGGYPNHPFQKDFFEETLDETDKGDLVIYGSADKFDQLENFLKNLKHVNPSADLYDVAEKLKSKLI